jgi:hypothetical protein
MRIKAFINPLIERIVRHIFSVDVYPDLYERLAYNPKLYRLVSPVLSDVVPAEVRSGGAIFIHIPKNAGTAIKRSLYGVDPGHLSSRFYALSAPTLLKCSNSFAVIRDPCDRFMSSYDFLIKGGGNVVRIHAPVMKRLSHIRTIDDYLDYLENINDWFLSDTSARPQWWYITDLSGKIAIKTLYVLGRDNANMSITVDSRTTLDIKHVNQTDRFTFSLTAEQKARVRRIYAPDVAIYEHLSAGGSSLYGADLETLTRRQREFCTS